MVGDDNHPHKPNVKLPGNPPPFLNGGNWGEPEHLLRGDSEDKRTICGVMKLLSLVSEYLAAGQSAYPMTRLRPAQ